jgi:hypothetical protein
MSEEKNTPEVPDHVPRVHSPGNGLDEAGARLLDLALYQMETGNPDGTVIFDPSSETLENVHASEIGTGSHSVHRGISSNYEMRLSALEEREKAADPDAEFEVTNARAYEKWAKEMEAIEAKEAESSAEEDDDGE